MKSKVKVLAFVVIVVGLLYALRHFGCPMTQRMGAGRAAPPPPNPAELKDTEERMELTLPPSARPLSWTCDSALDYTILLKVEIHPSDMQTLIQNSPFSTEPLRQNNDLFYHDIGGWWNEGARAQNFLFGETLLPQGQQYQDKQLQILVDMDRKDVYVVYLALFGD